MMHRRSRIGAFAGASFYFATLVLAGHHQGAEVHGYCAEHRSPVHLEHDDGHGHDDLYVPLGAVASTDSEHAEHGCVVAEWLAQSVHQSAPGVVARLPQRSLAVTSTGRRAARPAISLLRLSPKVSPPA